MKKNLNDYRNFMEQMDPDLKEFFAEETGLIKKKKNKASKKKAKFKIGDSVETNGTFGTIMFGPYSDSFGVEVYEVETEDNSIITASVDNIAIYVPPIEEDNEDDLL